jgi:hypothetical protein
MCGHNQSIVLEQSHGSTASDEFDDVECQAVPSARTAQKFPNQS